MRSTPLRPETLSDCLALEIVAQRKRAGLTQVEFAKRVGENQSALCRVERGTLLLTMQRLERYAAALGKRPSALLKSAERLHAALQPPSP